MSETYSLTIELITRFFKCFSVFLSVKNNVGECWNTVKIECQVFTDRTGSEPETIALEPDWNQSIDTWPYWFSCLKSVICTKMPKRSRRLPCTNSENERNLLHGENIHPNKGFNKEGSPQIVGFLLRISKFESLSEIKYLLHRHLYRGYDIRLYHLVIGWHTVKCNIWFLVTSAM